MDNNENNREILRRLQWLIAFGGGIDGIDEQLRQRLIAAEAGMRGQREQIERMEQEIREDEERLAALRQQSQNSKKEE